jgi:ferredoxin
MEDITITIIDREDVSHELVIPADIGLNLMELCKASELPVAGICGGMAMCGSCQVYVLSSTELSPPSDDELAMLDQLFYIEDNSRLGCQIKLNSNIDGLKVKLAPEQ